MENKNLKIDEWLIDDVKYTIKNFQDKFIQYAKIPDSKEDPYELVANAALIVARIGYGECFCISDIIEAVREGFFIGADGIGDWVDKEGNHLGEIYCNVKWLEENKPENAAFIMWYNK